MVWLLNRIEWIVSFRHGFGRCAKVDWGRIMGGIWDGGR
jgi:hypothetical protein